METVIMETAKIIALLNHLIEVCTDGEDVYREAAEFIHTPEQQRLFREESRLRGQMKRMLQAEVLRLQSEPENQGTLAGALERTWMSIKGHLGAGDQSLLTTLESNEDRTRAEFEHMLAEPLPAELRSLIESQYTSVCATHDRIRRMRDNERAQAKTAHHGRLF
jgi:uncharacterized protein (TIGR02284 family)